MTIASEITRIQTNIADAYTAASGKGATMPATENSDNLATCIASISGGGASGKYQLLERISDDNNNEIGTVSGFFTDANNTEYAVVCLDAQYRALSKSWASSTGGVTDLPKLDTYANVFSETNTATYNTQKILDWCTANGYTSQACVHCRSKSFTIDGITYYGQLPNRRELTNLSYNFVAIDNADTSASSYSTLTLQNLMSEITSAFFSSSQYNNRYTWALYGNGYFEDRDKTYASGIVPVLELPNS